MFFELIAAVVAGFMGAGAVMAVNLLSGGLLPRWAMPVAAGLAMIGFGIYMEYTWYDRTAGEFPDRVVVAATEQSSAPWRPWTYVWPMTNRLTAIDTDSIRRNAAAPDQAMAQIVFLGRLRAPRVVPMVFDCAEGRIAPLVDSVEFDAGGAVTGAEWTPVSADDPALTLVCKED